MRRLVDGRAQFAQPEPVSRRKAGGSGGAVHNRRGCHFCSDSYVVFARGGGGGTLPAWSCLCEAADGWRVRKRLPQRRRDAEKILGLKTTPVRRAGPPQRENKERPQDTQGKAYEEPQPLLSLSEEDEHQSNEPRHTKAERSVHCSRCTHAGCD